jgi:hypothetical protein
MIYTYTGGVSRWVEPGDFAAVRSSGQVSNLIQDGEEAVLWLQSRRHRQNRKSVGKWTHAILYVGGPSDLILEAEPGGCKLRPYHYDRPSTLWSTGRPALTLTPEQRAMVPGVAQVYANANQGKGVPYSFLDYEAIGLHALGLKTDGLRDYISDTGHMICSQTVDQCRLDLGSHLFTDDRWPGYVDPLDIAIVISESALSDT